jgi:hypothetical protein
MKTRALLTGDGIAYGQKCSPVFAEVFHRLLDTPSYTFPHLALPLSLLALEDYRKGNGGNTPNRNTKKVPKENKDPISGRYQPSSNKTHQRKNWSFRKLITMHTSK